MRRDVPVPDYIDGIRRELAFHGRTADRMELDTLYLGGGTPSRLGGAGISQLLSTIREHAHWSDSAEVTLEANPDDVTRENARLWRDAGVNRVSLGAQSFSPPALAWMRRTHDANQIAEAVSDLREAGISQLALDLIFALPENVPRDWGEDLERALALQPNHISIYGLTVEPHTPLGHWRDRGELTESPDTRYERDFLLTPADTAAERTYTGLRCIDGLVLTEEIRASTARWRDAGWARIVNDRLQLTALGWLRLDALAVDLTHAGSR